MKKKVFLVLLSIMIIFAVPGCAKKPASDAPVMTVNKIDDHITSKDEFINLNIGWTKRMEEIADETKAVNNDLNRGKFGFVTFIEKMDPIYSKMSDLNMEADKTFFNLSENDKTQVNYDAITKAYLRASKDLNDYQIGALHHFTAEMNKTKYKEMIETNYNNDVKELKKLLNI